MVGGALLAPGAHAADVDLEGENLLSESGATARSDPEASGGRAVEITPEIGAAGSFTLPGSAVHLFVRARGNDCLGAPVISVRIDGLDRYVGPVSTVGYTEVGARISLGTGAHSVAVALVDGFSGGLGGSPFCSRTALIDSITLVGEPFAAKGWRNARLSKRAPLARNSKALVAELRAQIKSRPRGAVIGTTQYSSPAYVVPRGQPRVKVTGPPRRDLQAQWDSVPLPPDARPAAGTDGHLLLWQPSTDTLWEFWGLSKDAAGRWRARFGGRMPHVSWNQGHFVDPPGYGFGATATSISLLAGMQRIEELRRGVIDHVVDFAVIGTRARDGWCWPAQRTDPQAAQRSKGAIPAGARFRLPAGFDLEAYARDPRHPLTRYGLTLARAVQRYGFVVRDTSSEVGFAAEDPGPLGYNPYEEIFEGASPDSLGALRNFPWRMLQVVAPPRGRTCVDDPDRD